MAGTCLTAPYCSALSASVYCVVRYLLQMSQLSHRVPRMPTRCSSQVGDNEEFGAHEIHEQHGVEVCDGSKGGAAQNVECGGGGLNDTPPMESKGNLVLGGG